MENKKDVIDVILDELYKKRVDWSEVERLVKELGPAINEMYDDEDCLLSYFIEGYYKGDIILELVKIFLNNGFDVHGNGGKNGALCLHKLCWSSYDKYILEVAELLLNEGADSTISMYNEEEESGVLDSIGFKLGYWTTGEYNCANIFSAYYKMIARHQEGKHYRGIRAFEDAKNLIITRVEKISIEMEITNDNGFEAIVLWSDNIPIVIYKYPEVFIYPYILEESKDRKDISSEFREILGKGLKGLQFPSAYSARIKFEGDYVVLISNDYLMGEKDSSISRYKIIKDSRNNEIKIEDKIRNIYFRNGITYADSVRKYNIGECFIQLENGDIYHVYPFITHHKGKIRLEKYDFNMCEKLEKCLKDTSMIINHIEKKDNAIRWIEIKSDTAYYYIIVDDGYEVEADLLVMKSLDRLDGSVIENVPNHYTAYSNDAKLEKVMCEYKTIEQ